MSRTNAELHHPGKKDKPRNGVASAFLIGLPLATLFLGLIYYGPLQQHALLARYVSHPVEAVEVIMFCCAMGALIGKVQQNFTERRALRDDLLPPWDGKHIPVTEAGKLLGHLRALPRRVQNSYVVKRIQSILDFLKSRGSANDLDDQLRAIADQDAIAVENSGALIRFITWAIPILGFLGTVLGITEAIAGVTPEVLEKSLSTVTDGLALAFDTTALALMLTMAIMFCNFLVDRLEQGVLESVDEFVEKELAHRFERKEAGVASSDEEMKRMQHTLTTVCEQLVSRQMELWSNALHTADQRRAEAEKPLHDHILRALETSLSNTLEAHTQRLAAMEKKSTDQVTVFLKHLSAVNQQMTRQAEALAALQASEQQLVRLQEVLHRNLEANASAGVFEQAVQSLTAAVHMLAVKAGSAPQVSQRKAA